MLATLGRDTIQGRMDGFLGRRAGWSRASDGRWMVTGASGSMLVTMTPERAFRVVVGRERYSAECLATLAKLVEIWEPRIMQPRLRAG